VVARLDYVGESNRVWGDEEVVGGVSKDKLGE
jgi:hypothetical protein